MKQTTNYNLVKPELTDSPPDITVMNPNWDKIDAKLRANEEQIENLAAYGVASGTNTYVATIIGITALTEGFTVRIKFTNANTGASTLNINSLGAKAIVKSNGASLSSGNIKAGQICNLAYTGSNFQLLGEGGEYGTATASDVLSGKTIGTEEGLATGTMPNHGALNQVLSINGNYIIPAGYHNGSGKVTQSITSKGSQTFTPGTTNQTIAAGQYLSGAQTIEGNANLVEDNIKEGVNIFGKIGKLKPAININKPIYTGRYMQKNSTQPSTNPRVWYHEIRIPVSASRIDYCPRNETIIVDYILFLLSTGGNPVNTFKPLDTPILKVAGYSTAEDVIVNAGNNIPFAANEFEIYIFNPHGGRIEIQRTAEFNDVYAVRLF